jgi:hypothetical protein
MRSLCLLQVEHHGTEWMPCHPPLLTNFFLVTYGISIILYNLKILNTN